MVTIHITILTVTINKYGQNFLLKFWPLQLLLPLDPMQNQEANHLCTQFHSQLVRHVAVCAVILVHILLAIIRSVSILMQFDMVCKYKIVSSNTWKRPISFTFFQHCNSEKLSWDIYKCAQVNKQKVASLVKSLYFAAYQSLWPYRRKILP